MWKGKKQRVSRQHAAEGEFWRKAENPLLNIWQFAWKVVVISLLLWSSLLPLHSLQRCSSPPVVKFNWRRKRIPGEQENIFQNKILLLITTRDRYKKKKKSQGMTLSPLPQGLCSHVRIMQGTVQCSVYSRQLLRAKYKHFQQMHLIEICLPRAAASFLGYGKEKTFFIK